MKIKQLRERLIVTQNELSKMLNVSISSVQNWELGRKNPSFKHKRAIKELCEKNNINFDDYI